MSESEVQARIMLAVGALPGVRVFRNTVGQAWQGEVVDHDRRARVLLMRNPRAVTVGLATDSPDLVGWRSRIITPADVGRAFAQFLGLEVKTATGRASPGQQNFLRVLNEAGALADIVRSPEEARRLVSL